MDILALPYINKGVYELSDLPKKYQDEISALLKTADEKRLVQQLEEHTAGLPRAMFFFKWYGRNQETKINILILIKTIDSCAPSACRLPRTGEHVETLRPLPPVTSRALLPERREGPERIYQSWPGREPLEREQTFYIR
jgi:hypothetical protein